ncbi:MAG: GYD domain-containing protein [Actinomycetota bacterium]
MAVYIMLSTLTDEGLKTLKDHPDRIRAVNAEVEKMGAKVVAQYAVLGPYDFVNILEAPDLLTVSRVAVELGSRGTLKTTTLAAVSVNEFIKGLEKK